MISLRLLNPLSQATSRFAEHQTVQVAAPIYGKERQEPRRAQLPALFAYSVKIVDLDPKSPKNLLNAYERFMRGVKFLETSKNLRRPCVF